MLWSSVLMTGQRSCADRRGPSGSLMQPPFPGRQYYVPASGCGAKGSKWTHLIIPIILYNRLVRVSPEQSKPGSCVYTFLMQTECDGPLAHLLYAGTVAKTFDTNTRPIMAATLVSVRRKRLPDVACPPFDDGKLSSVAVQGVHKPE